MQKQIMNLFMLEAASKEKKSCICPKSRCFNKPIPAAFLINMPGHVLLSLFKSGMYIYKKGI